MFPIVDKERFTNINKTNRFTNINRASRFTYINRIYRFIRIHRTYRLRTSIGRTGLLRLTGHSGFLVSTERTILEFTGLLELTVRTFLLEFAESIGLRTSTGRTGLLELTGCKGLLESTVQISTKLL